MISEFLSAYPPLISVFKRQDQAWFAFKRLTQLGREELGDLYGLASDFSEATDRVPFDLITDTYKIFAEVLEFSFESIEHLLGPRHVHLKDSSFISSRGIMMGEPFSQILLVSSVAAAEEMAFASYYKVSHWRALSWSYTRCFHIGGDDHFAVGPLTYLISLTEKCHNLGYATSKTKHGYSQVGVCYTERVIIFYPGIQINIKASEDGQPSWHDRSPFCDSIKVRLLSPFTRTIEVREDHNSAIGKAKSLAALIKYSSSNTFLEEIGRTAVARLFVRFRLLLPIHKSRTLQLLVKMPQRLGGLGLAFDNDVLDYSKLGTTLTWAIRKLVCDDLTKLHIGRIICKVFMARSSIDKSVYINEFMKTLECWPTQRAGFSWTKLHERLPELNEIPDYYSKTVLLRRNGFIPYSEMKRTLERPFKFQDLLSKPKETKQYRSTPLLSKLIKVWVELEKFGSLPEGKTTEANPLTPEEIDKAIASLDEEWWFDMSQEVEAYIMKTALWKNDLMSNIMVISENDGFRSMPIGKCIEIGAPNLRIEPMTQRLNKLRYLEDQRELAEGRARALKTLLPRPDLTDVPSPKRKLTLSVTELGKRDLPSPDEETSSPSAKKSRLI
jgi:hypothetical protein